MGAVIGWLVALAFVVLVVAFAGIRVTNQYERGVVFRLGRVQSRVRGPGLTVIIPRSAACGG